MSEFSQNHELDTPNPTLLENALCLGYPINHIEVPPEMSSLYFERDRVIEEALWSLQERHEAYSYIVQQTKMDVTIPPFEQWNPQGAELEVLRLEVRDQKIRMQMLDGFAEFVNSEKYMGRLLPQQRDALHATHNFMETKPRMDIDGDELMGKSGYIDMPTGTGKTGVIVAVAQALKIKESADDPVRVLVLVPTKQLLRQTMGDKNVKPSERKGFAKFAPRLDVTVFFQDEKEISSCTVMTNASFNQLVQSGNMPEFDAILVDESHTGLGENISDSIRQYYRPTVTIGFSATPDYHEEKMTAHLLQHKIFELSLRDAIETGKLAPVSAEHRDLKLEFDEYKLPEDPTERRNTINAAYFYARFRASIEDIKKAVRQGDGVLVRCPPGGDIEFAKKAAELLQQEMVTTEDRTYSGKILAVAVGGSKQKVRDLELLIGGFNRQKVQVITYVDIINMGTDLPPAKLFVDLWPTESSVKVKQGLGRALRPVIDTATGQPKEAKVITYSEPRLTNQFTCIDALNLRVGQSKLGKQREYVPQHEHDSKFSYTEIRALATPGDVARAAIQHDREVSYESPDKDDLISFNDACEQFNLDPTVVSHYLEEVGYEGQPSLPEDEYEALAQLIREATNLKEDKQPITDELTKHEEIDSILSEVPEGYIDAAELAKKYNWRGTTASFVKSLREAGFKLDRHKNERGGYIYLVPKHYIPEQYL